MTDPDDTPSRLPSKPTVLHLHQRDLDRLGQEIDDILVSTRQYIVERMVEVGERLIQAKAICPYGQWMDWLAARGIQQKAYERAVQLAQYHAYLQRAADSTGLSNLRESSLSGALEIVRAARAAAKSPRQDELQPAPTPSIAVPKRWSQQPDKPQPAPIIITAPKRSDEQTEPVHLSSLLAPASEPHMAEPTTRPDWLIGQVSRLLLVRDEQQVLAALWWCLKGEAPPGDLVIRPADVEPTVTPAGARSRS